MEQSRAAKLEARIKTLERDNRELIEGMASMLNDHDQLWALTRDMALRVQFTMEHFTFKKAVKSGLTDGTGAPLEGPPEIYTLYDIFVEKRDQYVKNMEARVAAQENTPVDANASGAQPESIVPDAGSAPSQTVRDADDKGPTPSGPFRGNFVQSDKAIH